MKDGYLNYNEFRNQFFDKFGNRKTIILQKNIDCQKLMKHIENISNIIKDISDNYDENMINKKDKKSILSIVAFTDNADIEYQDLINGLKANILTE